MNYSDDEEEEEKLSLIKVPELRNLKMRQLEFKSDSEDEDLSNFVNLKN